MSDKRRDRAVERASIVVAALHKLRDKLREELPGLKRIEIDVEYEDGAHLTQRIKLEAR